MGSLLSLGNGGGTYRHLKGCPHMPPSRSLPLQDAEHPKSLGCFVPPVQPMLFSLDSLNVAFMLSLPVSMIDLSSHGQVRQWHPITPAVYQTVILQTRFVSTDMRVNIHSAARKHRNHAACAQAQFRYYQPGGSSETQILCVSTYQTAK